MSDQTFSQQIAWAKRHMPRTAKQVASLPDLSHVRLVCNMHLDLKMIPFVEGLLSKNAKVYLTTCNPTTVQADVVNFLCEAGAEAYAWRHMRNDQWRESWDKAIAWLPTHPCEMGADIPRFLP